MGLKEWIAEFSQMHEEARAGTLDAEQLERYFHAREELAGALLAAQRLDLKGGQTARQNLRVQRTLQVDLKMMGQHLRAMTLDVSVGGFAAMLALSPPHGEHAMVSLKLPDDPHPLEARAIVVNLQRHGGLFRVSFSFGELPKALKDRLGFVVFDAVLATFK